MIGDVAVRGAGRKGLGVFALRQFDKGEFIFRRRYGRIVANTRILSLTREERRHLCEIDYARSAVLLAQSLLRTERHAEWREGLCVEAHPHGRRDHDRLSPERVQR